MRVSSILESRLLFTFKLSYHQPWISLPPYRDFYSKTAISSSMSIEHLLEKKKEVKCEISKGP